MSTSAFPEDAGAPRRPWPFRVAAAVALVQSLALIVNGAAIGLVVLRDGITGPSAVSSPAGVAFEVALYMLFGAALLWVARSLFHGSTAGLTGFALAQLLGLAVLVPLAQGSGAASTIGWLGVVLCAIGLGAWGALLRHTAPDR